MHHCWKAGSSGALMKSVAKRLPIATPALPRNAAASDVEAIIRRIVWEWDGRSDSPGLLPPEAQVEPGVFIMMIHSAWRDNAPYSGEGAHSTDELDKWLRSEPNKVIRSLQHKLKGRMPVDRSEVAALLQVFFDHWEPAKDNDEKSKSRPFKFEDKNRRGEPITTKSAADRITNFLFGPIYGVARKTLRIVEPIGINIPAFLEAHKKERAIIVPVLDRAMYGGDPAATIFGTRESLEKCLDSDARVKMIWLVRGGHARDTRDYANYLYQRNFLATLLQYLRRAAKEQWGTFVKWDELTKRIFVFVHDPDKKGAGPSTDYILDDFVPERAPEHWRKEIKDDDGQDFSFEKFGLFVVAEAADEERDQLSYWKYTKVTAGAASSRKRKSRQTTTRVESVQPLAATRMECDAAPQMISAHQIVIKAAEQTIGERKGDAQIELLRSMGWRVMTATEFLKGDDLEPQK